jgi:hypothetical protein
MGNIQQNEFKNVAIRIPKEDAPPELHKKLALLGGKIKSKTGKEPAKKTLVVELLLSHPKLRYL